jgi:hypothetical protein
MTDKNGPMSDVELDALLAHASEPRLPAGANERLLARLAGQKAHENVVSFRRAEPQQSRLGWLASLPLAASLALGIYLGSAGSLESLVPTAAYELLVGVNIDDPVTGIEDVESLTEDDVS